VGEASEIDFSSRSLRVPGWDRRAALKLVGGAWIGLGAMTNAVAASPADDDKIYFAGHAFLVRFADIAGAFPNLSGFLTKERSVGLDQALGRTGRDTAQPRGLDVQFDQLGTLSPGGDAYVLALAFDREAVATTQIGETWKLLVELSFQALVFDFHSKMVVASFPLTTQYIDASAQRPGSADIERVLDHLLFGNQPTGVQAIFWETVNAAALPRPGARSLKVSEVSLSTTAAASVAEFGIGNTGGFRDQLAHDFGKYLSANQRLSVLPYASSQAVGGKMAACLANGDVFTLSIPEADYTIALRLDGLKKVQTAATVAGAVWVYGVFFTVRVAEPLSGRDYFNSQLKLGAVRTVPASLREDSDWLSYAEVIQQFFDEFTVAVARSDDEWLRKHLVGGSTSATTLKPFQELVQSCR
jgi:hypothetical protein